MRQELKKSYVKRSENPDEQLFMKMQNEQLGYESLVLQNLQEVSLKQLPAIQKAAATASTEADALDFITDSKKPITQRTQ